MTDETKEPMDDKCRLCGELRPEHISYFWTCCDDDVIKLASMRCLERRLAAAQAELAEARAEESNPEVDHLAEAKKQITMSLPAAIRHIIDHLESQPTVAQEVRRLCLAATGDAHPTSIVGAPLTKLAEAAEREGKS